MTDCVWRYCRDFFMTDCVHLILISPRLMCELGFMSLRLIVFTWFWFSKTGCVRLIFFKKRLILRLNLFFQDCLCVFDFCIQDWLSLIVCIRSCMESKRTAIMYDLGSLKACMIRAVQSWDQRPIYTAWFSNSWPDAWSTHAQEGEQSLPWPSSRHQGQSFPSMCKL